MLYNILRNCTPDELKEEKSDPKVLDKINEATDKEQAKLERKK